MRTEEIRSALRRHHVTTTYFADVYPFDLLPPLRHGKAYIVNSQSSEKEGEHWMTIYRRHDGVVQFLDSYGLPPPKFLCQYKTVEYNGVRYQGIQPTCGLYCLLFVLSIKKPELLNQLDPTDWAGNDNWIRKFGMREFGASI